MSMVFSNKFNLILLKTFVIRHSPRFWWRYKFRLFKAQHQAREMNIKSLNYILFSPELDTFTYEIENKLEIESGIVEFLGLQSKSNSWAREFSLIKYESETIFQRAIHVSHSKFAPKVGRHFVTFALTRGFMPSLVIESGIKHGLGSHVLSRAIQLNSQINSSQKAKYLGIDIYPKSGHLCRYDQNICRVTGDSISHLKHLIEANEQFQKILFISDSIPGNQIVEELNLVLRLVQSEILFIYNKDWEKDIIIPKGFSLLNQTTVSEKTNHPVCSGRVVRILHIERNQESQGEAQY